MMTYTISVFQQIDIDQANDGKNGALVMRMFGVTEVRGETLELQTLTSFDIRLATAYSQRSLISCHISMYHCHAVSQMKT
jgi:hypothetical protein